LAEEGRRILQAGAAASDAVASFRAGKAGAVRVGGTPVFMDGVIIPMIASFQMQNPEVRIEQCYGYAGDLSERLLNGSLDFAICPLRNADLQPGLQFDPILPGRNVIASRDGHPLAKAKSMTEMDLLKYPWIAPPSGSPLFSDLQRVLHDIGAAGAKISFSGGSLSAVLEMLSGSDSLTVLPYAVVFTQRRQFNVRPLPIKIEHPDRRLGLLYVRDPAPTPSVRRMKAFVAAQFASLAAVILHQERQSVWHL
jgi:DNA-binding transcriptional LysR family regulator